MVKKVNNQRSKSLGGFLILIAAIFLINVISDSLYKRFDLTKEKRYTLSESTHNLLDKLDDELFITVYLEGDLPVDYKRLRTAVQDMLNEYRYASNGKISFVFEDILGDEDIETKRKILKQLFEKGVQIERPEVEADEAPTEKYILPSALLLYKGKEFPLNFMKREFGRPLEEEINGSIELLEYEIDNVVRKCIAGKELKIAFTEGHGELDYIETADISKELNDFYSVERLNINIYDTACIQLFAKEIRENPGKEADVIIESLMKRLNSYDGLIIAKPTRPFKKIEKYLLDQYVMNGGKIVWLVESLIAEMDSIAKYGKVMTANYDHNLDDILFAYGAKVKPTLVQDLQCHGIPAINQQTNRPGFFKWNFYPLFNPADDNPITKNLESVWGRYCSTLDTTGNKLATKTILLKSSKQSRVAQNPVLISLDLLSIQPNPDNFRNPDQISAILLEGSFVSPFKYRPSVRSSINLNFKDSVANNAMIVIGDGDLIKNQVSPDKSQVYPLGYDKYASQHFGQEVSFANTKFFLNCVDYLCDESNIIEVRSKEVVLRLLNKSKIKTEKRKWQWINMGLPIAVILIFGLANAFYRRKRWN